MDEFAIAGLLAAPGVRVTAPRVATAPISLECRVSQIARVGNGPHRVVFGEIVYMHVRGDLYDAPRGASTSPPCARSAASPATSMGAAAPT